MMLVLSGLHGAGKSHLSSLIAKEFGWEVCVKRDLLKLLHSRDGDGGDWVAWYRALYASIGPHEVTKKLLGLVPQGERVVLDSVHNYAEWNAVRECRPDGILATVIAPKSVRASRNGLEDAGLDDKRVSFWHEDGKSHSCLIAESEWCFNGATASSFLRTEFEAFLAHYATR